MERRAATAAVGVLSFETDHPPEADLSIPEGTVCMTAAQVRFETTEAGVLKAGRPPPRCGPERWSRARREMRRPGRCVPWRWRRWG
ncbi:MAG: baseplate J/gp47 family protein [Flavonifractor plautii]